ncbi:AvrE-family type 3 secretion system effector [Pseudomonas sp. MDT1-17]
MPFIRRNALRGEARRVPRQQQPVPKERPASVHLDAKGTPLFQAFKSTALGDLLYRALGESGQTYQASHSADLDQFLLDAKGHVLHLRQSPEAMFVVRSSQAQGRAAGHPNVQRLECQQGAVQVVGDTQQSTPLGTLPRAHMGYLTGIHQDQEGRRLYLHEQQLYAFDDLRGAWVLSEGTQDMKFSALLAQGNGKLYGQVDGALVDLSSQGMTQVALPGGVKAFSVSADQHIAVLSGDQDQVLHLINLEQDPSVSTRSVTLKLHDGLAQAKSIGLSQHHLFISDTEGRLYSVRRDELDREELELQPQQYRYSNHAGLGANQQVVGFLSGNEGQIQALVSDREQVHSHSLDGDTQGISSGWNLSDVLVVNTRRGLPTGVEPTPTNTLDLGRLGRIGLSEQRIKFWDTASQDWKDTDIKEVEQLQRGMDGEAYMIQNGTLKKLGVSRKSTPLAFGGSHALNQLARSTAVAVGDNVAGLEGLTVVAFAMLSDKQFVVMDSKHTFTVHHKDGEPTKLKYTEGVGKITSLALDEHHHLYAMTDWGELFVMAKDDWQASEPRAEAVWKSVAIPPGAELTSIRSAGGNRLSAAFSDGGEHWSMQLKDATWHPLAAKPVDQNPFEDLAKRLRTSEKVMRLPGTGLTVRANANLMGRSAMENANTVSTPEFIRANIFKPTWEVPRVLKNMGHYIQHQYQGRKGLGPVYESESSVFQRLHTISQNQTAAADGRDLKSRIAGLNLGPEGLVLQQALEAFRGALEDTSHRALKQLGQQHGRSKLLQQKAGLLNIHGHESAPSRRRDVSMKLSQLSQKLNVNSSGHDLLKTLKNSLTYLAPTGQNRADGLLSTLQAQGMQLSHQKADVPLGQRRDGGESLGLTKARLALDTVTLIDLVHFLDDLESFSSLADGADLKTLQIKFEAQRAAYEDNQIRQVTEMGFTDHANLEASYDGIKAFLNGFKKADHAISVNLRAATGSKTQAELAQALRTTLKYLNSDDEIALQRSYGLNLSTPSIGVSKFALGLSPSGGVSGVRSYAFNAELGDKGLKVCLQRDGSASATVGIGGGFDLWPGFFNAEQAAQFTNINLGNNRSLTPAFSLGVDASAISTVTQRNAVVFTVLQEDIDDFVDNLFSGNLNPLQVMQKGIEHTTQKSLRFNVDINASGTAEFRAGFGLSEKGSSPLSAAMRIGVGSTVNVNLLNYANHSVEQRNNKEQTQESSQNRPRFINSIGASGSAKAQINGSYSTPEKNSLGAGLALGGGGGVGVDNKTSKRIKFTFKEAVPLTAKNLKELTLTLGDAFKDPSPQQELARLADRDLPVYKDLTPEQAVDLHLTGLNSYFALHDKNDKNDRQYAALRTLQRSSHQHEAARQHYSLLDSANFESAYTNLSRLDEQGVVSSIMGLVSAHHSPSNAQKVASLLEQDSTLQSLIKQLQASTGTLAKVRLELKDGVQDEIHARSCNGELSQQDLAALLSDRKNMRIKAITVSQSASKSEGFASPVPVVSYSSNASLNVTKAVGKIDFSYGQDQDTPQSYALEGELSNPSEAFSGIVGALKKEGFELNR